MAVDEHPMERRTNALADGLTARVDMLAAMMRPDGRQIYHTRQAEQKAIEFWQRNRFTDLGQQVMSTWTPDQIMDLDRRLMEANQMGGQSGASS